MFDGARRTYLTMDENPYKAPEAAVQLGKQRVVVRVIAAALVAAIGVTAAVAAAEMAGLLLRERGAARDIAMYGFPAFTTAAAGGFVLAYGIASRRRRASLLGAILFVAGIAAWIMFLVAAGAGWFQ
jgi:hypothetical protein